MDYGRVVLGIGNPGPDYAETRHNAGFLVLDGLAERLGVTFRRLERRAPDGTRRFGGKVKAHVARVEPRGGDESGTLLVKPLTYVNLSGDVAGPLLAVVGAGPESLFVVVDDLNLPLGRIRIRPAGGPGGHNGLKSIQAALCSDTYPRLRLGIGPPAAADPSVSSNFGSEDTVDYVLARFLPEEQQVLETVLERAVDVLLQWLDRVPLETLMGDHNGFDARAADVDARSDPGESES